MRSETRTEAREEGTERKVEETSLKKVLGREEDG